MKLTQRQESLVTRYLRDVAIQLDQEMPEYDREQGLAEIQRHIDRDLRSLGRDTLEDTEIEAVLLRLGSPARQANILSPRRDPRRVLMPARDNVVWLGVCSGIAIRQDLDPWIVRAFAVVAGCVTGPMAVIAYICVYLYMRRNLPRRAPIDWLKIGLRAGAAIGIAFLLHIVTGYLFDITEYVYAQYLKRDLPDVGDWGWLRNSRDEYLFYALIVSTPFAVLSALPLAGGWDYTIKRLSQATLALYGIALSFGIASFIVGLILDFVSQFSLT